MNKNQEAFRRLQDMLAGWENFVHTKYENHKQINLSDTEYDEWIKEGDTISDLYQASGNITANDIDYSEDEPSIERIKKFIEEQVIPVILNGVEKP